MTPNLKLLLGTDFTRLVRFARQNTTHFYALRFMLPFRIIYRLLFMQADG